MILLLPWGMIKTYGVGCGGGGGGGVAWLAHLLALLASLGVINDNSRCCSPKNRKKKTHLISISSQLSIFIDICRRFAATRFPGLRGSYFPLWMGEAPNDLDDFAVAYRRQDILQPKTEYISPQCIC